MQNPINKSLYIHIPFCEHICSYCDFTKLFYNSEFSKAYINELIKEIKSYDLKNMETIYIGGGTPTALTDEEFLLLLKNVEPLLAKDYEFCIEANVENLTLNKLKIMKQFSVNRLSIGIQSSHDDRLKQIGRFHNFDQAKRVVSEAKKYGFDSINVDLIYGYPNETLEELKEDLNNILKLNVDHISIYSLTISKGTIFYNKNIKEQNNDDSRLFYDVILSTLRKNGFERYEISNFAKNKKYSRHNLTYWKDKNYCGVGLGASGYLNNVRYTNTCNLNKYLESKYIDEKEEITIEKDLEYFLLTNLRLEQGFLRKDFFDKFNFDFLEKYKDKVIELEKNGLIIIDEERVRLSDEGLMIMDSILLKLF